MRRAEQRLRDVRPLVVGITGSYGKTTTKLGKPYNNRYCAMCRIVDGKLTEVTEYLDTALVDEAL